MRRERPKGTLPVTRTYQTLLAPSGVSSTAIPGVNESTRQPMFSTQNLLLLTSFVTALMIGVISSGQGSAQSNSTAPVYFPPDQIQVPIAAVALASLGEPSFFEASKDMSVVAFRLSYFSPVPERMVAVRLVVNVDGSGQVASAVSSGAGSGIKRSQNSVSVADVSGFLQLLTRVEFWSMPSSEGSEQKTDAAGRKPYVMDGAFLTVEGVQQGSFHYVSRLNPKPGSITELACHLAADLAKPAVPPFQSGCVRLGQGR